MELTNTTDEPIRIDPGETMQFTALTYRDHNTRLIRMLLTDADEIQFEDYDPTPITPVSFTSRANDA